MTDRILIDGYNLCWKLPQIKRFMPERLEIARNTLIRFLKDYYSSKKTHITVVFDGQPGIVNDRYPRSNKINVRFSKYPQTADQLIIQFLRNQKNKNLWTIVSSDNEVCNQAKGYDARVLSAETFISRLKKSKKISSDYKAKHDPRLSPGEISEWKDIFGTDESE